MYFTDEQIARFRAEKEAYTQGRADATGIAYYVCHWGHVEILCPENLFICEELGCGEITVFQPLTAWQRQLYAEFPPVRKLSY